MLAKKVKLKLLGMSKLSEILHFVTLTNQTDRKVLLFFFNRFSISPPLFFHLLPSALMLPLKERPALTLQNGGEEQGVTEILCQGVHAAGGTVQKGGENGWSNVKCQLLRSC